jgi:hypothetical protein
MPIRVVLDHSRRHTGRRLRRGLVVLVGCLLVLLGLAASIVAIPSSFFVVGFVVGWLSNDPSDPFPPDDMPVNEILLAWGLSTPLAIVGLKGGLRLVRRHRKLVLFLRRFGYDDATSAVTFAVARTIGPSWRLVTLDDAEIAPLGIPAGTRRLFRLGRVASSTILGLGHLLAFRVFPAATLGMWVIVGLALVRAQIWRDPRNLEAWMTVAAPYLRILSMTLDRRLPFHAIAPDLPGVFALLATTAALSFVALMVVFVALLLAFPLGAVLFFLSWSADAVRDAERSKTAEIRTETQIGAAISKIAARSRKVFGARLVVLRVKAGLWQQAVSRLATVSSLSLVDVSEPTVNLAWEIEELRSRLGSRCVFIGRHDRALRLAAAATAPSCTPVDKHVSLLLEGEEILAYTSGRRGMRRFARALRGKLLSVSTEPDAPVNPRPCRPHRRPH